MLWLFSVLAFNALILAIANAADHLPLHAPWAAARPHFWPVLTLRFFYLLALAGLFWLLTANAASPWAWLASALLSALAGLLLNLSTRAILLDPHPLSALRALLGQPWPLFKVWIGSQVLSMLTLLSFLLMILVLEVITLIVFYAFGSHLEDPYYGLLLVVLGVFVAIPTFFFVAVAGAFINSYWTLAYLRLRP
jgi:hypothetical protein